MGTRNLTCVVYGGKYLLAKYGHNDGYPSLLGVRILNFLRQELKVGEFLEKLICLRQLSYSEANALRKASYVAGSPQWPELEYDTLGDEMLQGIQSGKFKQTYSELSFAADSLFCEWCYVIDLDKKKFEVYNGFNQSPLPETERFFFLQKKKMKEYYPIRLKASFGLKRLPQENHFFRKCR